MNYNEAMDYINSVSRTGIVLGLESIEELLRRLGNPQDKLKFVHIAGTNGKGSALSYISTILKNAGYKTGVYLSPVIFQYNEKIQINGEYIDNDSIQRLVEKIKSVCDGMVLDDLPHPTLFEIETAMAFMYYLENECDIVVLEVGMGGESDATNVIKNTLVSVIMSISLDHVGMIGNNLCEIARCKAGIIKPDSKVVLYRQCEEVMNVVKDVAHSKNSKLVITNPDTILLKEDSLYGQVFDYAPLCDIVIRLLGEHQRLNAIAAIEAVYLLRECGYEISDEAVLFGLKNTMWPARFEIVSSRPLVIMDGAHNPDGARALRNSVEKYLAGYTKIFIMGVLADKDYREVIRLTNDLASVIITIDPDNKRALSDSDLKCAVNEEKTRDIPVLCAGRIEGGIEMAIQIAMQLGDPHTAIVAFGSLSFLGDLSRYLYQQ